MSDAGVALRTWRKAEAQRRGFAAFQIFSNAELDMLLDAAPRSIAELRRVRGFGAWKCEQYGASIVDIISAAQRPPQPSPPATAAPSALPPQHAQSQFSHHLANLVSMGFAESQSRWALQNCSFNVEEAIQLLLGSSGGSGVGVDRLSSSGTSTSRQHVAPRAASVVVELEDEEVQRRPPLGHSVLDLISDDDEPQAQAASCSQPDDDLLSDSLSVSELKQILAERGVSTAGCVEKRELFQLLKASREAPRDAKRQRRASPAASTSATSFESLSVATAAAEGPSVVIDEAPAPSAEPASPTLNAEQRRAAARIEAGENVFLTGAAGVGKSFLLVQLISRLQAAHGAESVAITASTGVAAVPLGGQTLHSWAGIGQGSGTSDQLVSRVLTNEAATQRWRSAAALVIDEVSMLDDQLFTKLEAIARSVRTDGRPFGGLQLLLVGDFFQLPPVEISRGGGRFAFLSPKWASCSIVTIALTTIVRQAGDREFIQLLGEVRRGLCSAETAVRLAACHIDVKSPPTDGILPTKIACHNRRVDEENELELARLPSPEQLFDAIDLFRQPPSSEEQAQRLRSELEGRAPGQLRLKLGAQVALTRNWLEHGLANGSRGVVVRFGEPKGREGGRLPVVRFDSGAVVEMVRAPFGAGPLQRLQLPLKLAWACTVHKSQGMTISRAIVEAGDAFDYGQVYVALSRVTSLAGLWIRGPRVAQRAVKAHPDVLSFYSGVQDSTQGARSAPVQASPQVQAQMQVPASRRSRPSGDGSSRAAAIVL